MRDAREHREDLLNRVPLFRAAIFILLGLVAMSFWVVQIAEGARYRELAENNRLRKLREEAPRGLIYDRHGRLLVENVPSYNLLLEKSRSADLDASIAFASGVLGRPADELTEVLDGAGEGVAGTASLLAEGLNLSQVSSFGVAELEHPEFEIEVRDLRLYRHGPQTAHVLGYLSEASDREIADLGLLRGDAVGKSGVEQQFDGRLRGTPGERVVVVDNRGRLKKVQARKPEVPGRSLPLTLDLELQQIAARYFEDRVGAAVVMNPQSGEVLAMVSAPSFNPNLFTRRLNQQQWTDLLTTPHDPLQNRVIQNAYAPGSVFKIVLAVAGLSEGTVDPDDTRYCRGSTRLYNRTVRCWKRAGHGTVDLREAIKESCDVYFYHLGQALEISPIARYARLFGLGSSTELGLRGEKAGLVPDPAWSLRARGYQWYPGETVSVAIGQGPLLVTPLQVAVMMGVVANGGYRVTPTLTGSGVAGREGEPLVDAAVLDIVREALWAVVSEQGTGASASLPGIDIAGKTGTAQVVRQATWIDNEDLPEAQRDHAWFASFAPVEDPELVVVVFVEHGGKGSQAAAPLARQLYAKYFENDPSRSS